MSDTSYKQGMSDGLTKAIEKLHDRELELSYNDRLVDFDHLREKNATRQELWNLQLKLANMREQIK
jgi:hypothetical protein